MGSFVKLSKRALETKMPVMVEVLTLMLLPSLLEFDPFQ